MLQQYRAWQSCTMVFHQALGLHIHISNVTITFQNALNDHPPHPVFNTHVAQSGIQFISIVNIVHIECEHQSTHQTNSLLLFLLTSSVSSSSTLHSSASALMLHYSKTCDIFPAPSTILPHNSNYFFLKAHHFQLTHRHQSRPCSKHPAAHFLIAPYYHMNCQD